jgi:hypothetical protein
VILDDVRAALAIARHGGLHDPERRDRREPDMSLADVDGEAHAGGGAGDKSNARIPDVSSGTRSVGRRSSDFRVVDKENAY